ncbi:ferredoxin-like protein [Perilla frutescens var. frutescens]|nr:ferredoxin-like protein [Perilla frutescens var. frutescens]
MKAKKFYCSFQFIVFCYVLLQPPFVCSKNHGNAANDLLDIINNNRTSQKLPKLSGSPGLGCIALQYAQECKGNCSSNNTIHCQPSEDDFTEVFAPNCGVELPTFGTISGFILGCHQKYLQPPEAYSNVLVQDQKTISLLRNKTITEVGVGIIGSHKHKGPYIWCLLFSNSQTNSTFVLENLGKGIEQKRGCYSGTSLPCSAGHKSSGLILNTSILLLLIYSLSLLFQHC